MTVESVHAEFVDPTARYKLLGEQQKMVKQALLLTDKAAFAFQRCFFTGELPETAKLVTLLQLWCTVDTDVQKLRFIWFQ